MRHYGQSSLRCQGEDAVERLCVVHQHIAGRGTHKHFDARHQCSVNGLQFLDISVGGTNEATVVDDALANSCVSTVNFPFMSFIVVLSTKFSISIDNCPDSFS